VVAAIIGAATLVGGLRLLRRAGYAAVVTTHTGGRSEKISSPSCGG
jgi:hypothetical protein